MSNAVASKIDPKNHPKAQTLMPMKETSRGFIYHGEWINNKPDGFGRVFFPNGEYFEGEFMEGKAKGEGRYFYNNDAFFEGKIDDNKAEGEGRYESKDVSFSGTWEHSKPHVGVFYLSDKTRIEKKDEHRAVIDWPDGRHYEGEIDEELNPSGQGKITFANGNSYEGEWRRGLMNGIGTYKWANGQRYEGTFPLTQASTKMASRRGRAPSTSPATSAMRGSGGTAGRTAKANSSKGRMLSTKAGSRTASPPRRSPALRYSKLRKTHGVVRSRWSRPSPPSPRLGRTRASCDDVCGIGDFVFDR